MQYKLFENSINDKENILQTVLLNRGVQDWEGYLTLDPSCCESYEKLDHINEAIECFSQHFEKRDTIDILVDCDPDGQTSAALIYKYIKDLDKDYPVHYIIHHYNKAHGLAKMGEDFLVPNNTKLLIIPDAGTNDWKECNELINKQCDVIILDHHEPSEDVGKNKAIIVNNQMSKNYTNKSFSGVGIAYEFVRALDDYYVCAFADKYLDLVAFGNISDVMDIRSLSTRYYIEEGMKNINNKFLKALDKAQNFSTKGEINIHNISWYWTPIVNSMIRIGDFADRDLLFRAFIETDEVFDYKKRGSDEIIDEDIYTRAARLCKNTKSRQDKMRDNLFEELKDKVDLDDKVAIVVVDDADSGIIGLSCMKLCDYLKRPTIVLKEHELGVLGGSCRNYDGSPVKDFRDLVDSVGLFNFAQGHSGAFGTEIATDKLQEAREALNKSLETLEYDNTIYVDFILDIDELDIEFISTIDNSKWLYGTGIKEPLVAIENIIISVDDCSVMGANKDAVAFVVDGIKYCKFKLTEDDKLLQFSNGTLGDKLELDVVGNCSVNVYQGRSTAQVMISDYRIK